MLRSFGFVVYGRPQPAGSKRAFAHASTGRVVVVDDAKGSRPWKQEVAGAAIDALGGIPEPPPLDGPLELTVTFYLARPRSHYGSGRNRSTLRPTAPLWPATRPDATKLVRAVEDACTSLLWRDDAQIVRQHVEKRYGFPERCELVVRELGHELPPLATSARAENFRTALPVAARPRTAVATTAAA